MPYNYNYYNRPKRGEGVGRTDKESGHRMEYERNRKRVLASENVCALCGKMVDKTLKYPHPMCATVDHIIPVSKGGHPSDMDNLQLAHFSCNLHKSDRIIEAAPEQEEEIIDNRQLPLAMNWALYDENNQTILRKEVEGIEVKGRHLYADGIR